MDDSRHPIERLGDALSIADVAPLAVVRSKVEPTNVMTSSLEDAAQVTANEARRAGD